MELCTLGKINQKTLKLFDLKREVYHATMNWDNLLKANKEAKAVRYEALPKFPAVRRDLALILDKNVTFEQVKNVAIAAENKILKSVSLFDIYTGDKIPEGKKQYALSFVLQDLEKTLTDNDVEKVMSKLLSTFQNEFGATLR